MADELKEAEKEYPFAWLDEAIHIAVVIMLRRWRYIKAILKSRKKKSHENKATLNGLPTVHPGQKWQIHPQLKRDRAPGDPHCPICHGIVCARDLPIDIPISADGSVRVPARTGRKKHKRTLYISAHRIVSRYDI
jgi:hypothetical protein